MGRPSTFLITAIVVVLMISRIHCGPNPITDNESDESVEHSDYYYRFLAAQPYWEAYPKEYKKKMREHDQLEKQLYQLRDLDFKLREAWTVNDKPFNQN